MIPSRVIEKVQRFLFGDDIFISYSRRDGTAYAKSLAASLPGYSCYLDLLGTVPDKELPALMKKRIRRCTIFVLIGTEWAVQSHAVAEEIKEFVKTGRPIIAINFDGSIERSILYPALAGLPLETETAAAAKQGVASLSVIDRIVRSCTYTRHSIRMQRLVLWTSCIALFFLAGFITYRKTIIDQQKCVQARVSLKDHQNDALSFHEFPDSYNETLDELMKNVRNLCGE